MQKLEKIVIATRNHSKVVYYRDILSTIAHCIIGLDDLQIFEKPVESGETAEENAKLKAKYYSAKSNLPAFSEDMALYVDFLPQSQQPGTHVRRINRHDEVDDECLLRHWESIIAKVPPQKRTGKWRIAYSLATPSGSANVVSVDHPVMFFSPSSQVRLPGLPMSSLCGSIRFGKPSSEHTEEEKQFQKQKAAKVLKGLLMTLL